MSLWASKECGVEILPYKFWRMILQALYYAAVASVTVLKVLARIVCFVMPSGLQVILFDGANVPDFRIPKKKFWGLSLYCHEGPNPTKIFTMPFPSKPLEEVWKNLINPISPVIPGSDLWTYRDELDGAMRLGVDCTPPRAYHVLGEGLIDSLNLAVVVGIASLLNKLGLGKMAAHFVKWCYDKYWDYQLWWVELPKLDEIIDSMKENIEESRELNLVLKDLITENQTLITDNKTLITDVKSLIGLRLMFR